MTRKPLGGRGTYHAQLDASKRAQIVRGAEQALDKRIHRVGAGKDNPIERAGARTGVIKRSVVLRWENPDHRCLDRFSAHCFEPFHELAGPLTWPGDQDPFSEKRTNVEPA